MGNPVGLDGRAMQASGGIELVMIDLKSAAEADLRHARNSLKTGDFEWRCKPMSDPLFF
jgi:hypothetical protein